MALITVYAPAAAIDTRDAGLEPLMFKAMQYGKAREVAPNEIIDGVDTEMAVVRDLDSKLISAQEVTGILQYPGARVDNYPCFAKVPDALLDAPVPFDCPGIAVLVEEFDEEGNSLGFKQAMDGEDPVPDTPRTWAEMPNLREYDGETYVTLAIPITNRITNSSRHSLRGGALKAALDAGVTLIDEATMRDIVAANSQVEDE